MLAQVLIVFGTESVGLSWDNSHHLYLFHRQARTARSHNHRRDESDESGIDQADEPVEGWIGFNAGFGLGLLLFGTTYLLLAAGQMTVLHDSPAPAWLPVAGGAAQLAIAADTLSAGHSWVSPLRECVSW